MSAGTTSARPVNLEANRTGQWRFIAQFDAGSEVEESLMRQGVEALAQLDNSTAFRVIKPGPLGGTLLNYSARHGWTQGKP